MTETKTQMESPEDYTVRVHFGRKWRKIKLVVGAEYVVEPLNAQKKKHRGRRCVVLGIVGDDIGFPVGATVKFLDTGRRGVVDPTDLKAPGLTWEKLEHGPGRPRSK